MDGRSRLLRLLSGEPVTPGGEDRTAAYEVAGNCDVLADPEPATTTAIVDALLDSGVVVLAGERSIPASALQPLLDLAAEADEALGYDARIPLTEAIAAVRALIERPADDQEESRG